MKFYNQCTPTTNNIHPSSKTTKMTKKLNALFSILCIFLCTQLSAQLALEHTYNFKLRRLNVEGLGAVYVRDLYKNSAGSYVAEFYSSQHQLLQSTILNIANPNMSFVEVTAPSVNLFDTDARIEFFVSGLYQSGGKLYNDGGEQLSPVEFTSSWKFITLIDGSKKIINQNKIYSVPSLLVEHEFPQYTGVDFIRLEQAGDKYYYLSQTTTDFKLVLVNSDYTPYKTLSSGIVPESSFSSSGAFNLSQYKINGDDAIEWNFSYKVNSNPFTHRIYSDENVLINYNQTPLGDISTLYPSSNMGVASTKLINLKTLNSPYFLKVIDVQSGLTEFTKNGVWAFGDTYADENSFKYWQYRPDSANMATLPIINADYSSWGEFTWNSADDRLESPLASIYDNDATDMEFLVFRPSGTIFLGYYLFYDQNGNELFKSEETGTYVISRMADSPNKFMTWNGTKTLIYSLPSSGPTSLKNPTLEPTLLVKAFPNPFTDILSIDLTDYKGTKGQISLYDVFGKLIKYYPDLDFYNIQSLEITQKLPSGIYWLKVVDVNGAYGWTKVVKE
jgi:Secretion system C-terminal sorting domain